MDSFNFCRSLMEQQGPMASCGPTGPCVPAERPPYDIVLDESFLQQIVRYKNELLRNRIRPGAFLMSSIKRFENNEGRLEEISNERFLELLLSTKKPTIFAESQIRGDGSDWNSEEIEILGGVNVTMPVEVYDNGVWSPSDRSFREHRPPLQAELLFSPGILLSGNTPEYQAIVAQGGRLDQERYNLLVDQKLAPLFVHANEDARKRGTTAVVTVPGIGCGCFAGRFRGRMGSFLSQAIQGILMRNCEKLRNIRCVYFDPFDECDNFDRNFSAVQLRVRPSRLNFGKPQLCHPTRYQEAGDDFSDCKLYKIVAWDHVSLPGNDYYVGSRNTDDGVAAAATNSMHVITGVRGQYKDGHYLPPFSYAKWMQVVTQNNINLRANGNVKVVTADRTYLDLADYERMQGSGFY